jgi:hypothetical protein
MKKHKIRLLFMALIALVWYTFYGTVETYLFLHILIFLGVILVLWKLTPYRKSQFHE